MGTDRTVELVKQGYSWAPRLRGGAPAVATRLMGRMAAVVGGPEGVRRFYDPRLSRRRALPKPIELVLFGPGTVHSLDDAEHHHHKAMFLDVLSPDAVAALGGRAEQEWEAALRRWSAMDRVVLFDEAVHVLAASVLPWAGVPVTPDEVPRRARQLAAVLDGFATPGAPYVRAVVARLQIGRWAKSLVRETRAGRIRPAPGTALHEAARLRHADGRPLPEHVAATALLNVVRPTIAVAWFVAFAGVALHEHPRWRERIADGDEAALAAFVHEVRRLYPFVPVLPARTREEQDVLGVRVPRGGLVVLDVYGTDHDPEHWPDPDRFDPERFLSGAPDATIDEDTLVPQGGGDRVTGHRCPGESVALTMLAVTVRTLACLPHTLPPQDLRYDLSRVPTRPRSGVVLAPGRTAARPGERRIDHPAGQA